MKKQLLKKLISISYKNGEMNDDSIRTIADKLSRKDLKEYIRALRSYEQKQYIIIQSAQPVTDNTQNAIKEVYSNKKIVVENDPSLLLGIRIIDNDMITDINLKNTLEALEQYITL